VLSVDQWPTLRSPILVVALAGWVDAGVAGGGAAAYLTERLGSAQRFGRFDLSDALDLQQLRPTVSLIDGTTRELRWPSIELTAGNAGRDVVVMRGPEPALRWKAFLDETVTLANRLGVERAVMLGGMPAAASHRRPMRVLATATARSVAQEAGPLRGDYEGPTGAQTVLQMALGEAGVPAIGLWAQVPHYLAGMASPPAIRALLERLRDVAGITVDLSSLDAQVDAYVAGVENSLSERPELTEIIQALEAASSDLPTGDEIASEIERFLRER
jgi:proteasome assembly chaperone (PAC2) family protein